MKRTSLWTLLALALSVGLGACDSAQEVTAPQSAPESFGPEYVFTIGDDEQLITPAGGYLQVGDNWLLVPRGAVKRATVFKMVTWAAPDPYPMGVELTARDAHGPVEQFQKELILSLSYSDLDITGPVALFRVEDDGSQTNITRWDDTARKRVYGATDHFTKFLIADL